MIWWSPYRVQHAWCQTRFLVVHVIPAFRLHLIGQFLLQFRGQFRSTEYDTAICTYICALCPYLERTSDYLHSFHIATFNTWRLLIIKYLGNSHRRGIPLGLVPCIY